MKHNFSAKWQELNQRANAMSVRERMIIAGAVAVILLGLVDQLLLRPWMTERVELEKSRETLRAATTQVTQDIATLEQRLAHDPNQLLREKIDQLNQRHAKVDAAIASITDGMIAPELMPALLGELLSERSGLKVQSISSRPAQQILSADKANQQAPAIYRHDLEMRLEGSFFQVQQYLHSIEQLPGRMIWDQLTYEVEQHPDGQLMLAVHTLSAREELIRVSR